MNHADRAAAGDTLSVRKLSVGYAGRNRAATTVVWNVDLLLEAGTILGLVGESGSGKSTTALALVGYRPAGMRIGSGSSRLGDLDLLALPPRRMRTIWGARIAYVPQNASLSLNPALTVGRQLAEPLVQHLGLRGAALRERQLELLESMELARSEDLLDRYPFQFSGGEQQRIAIALALSCRPEILILDEPTTGLDVTTQAKITSLLRRHVSQAQVAALYVSHDLSLLASVADRIAVMYAGQIVESGPMEAVYRQPRHPYTRALLDAVPSVRRPRVLAAISGEPPRGVVSTSCAFAPRCPHRVDACVEQAIPLEPAGPAHVVRCIRSWEIAQRARPAPTLPEPVRGEDEPLLEVVDLWCSYGGRDAAVKGVGFKLGRGGTLGIVGQSGSGKSTLLRALVGLHPPVSGVIRYRGAPLAPRAAERPRLVRRDVQLVFQDPESSLNPRHTVTQIVERPITLFREDVSRSTRREIVAELLESMKLPRSLRSRYPGELSGGQKQRVALARAFAAEPSLLLCDEVTSALDVSVQATILELIAERAARSGTAIGLVSHDLGVVRTLTSQAIVIRNGEICEEGETPRLFASAHHPYTRALIAAIPEIAREAARGQDSR